MHAHCAIVYIYFVYTVTLQPPTDIVWELVSPEQLTFAWTPSATNCSNIHYNIFTSNYGSCPNTTISTTDLPADGNVCMFALQTVVCKNITGNCSVTTQIQLFV